MGNLDCENEHPPVLQVRSGTRLQKVSGSYFLVEGLIANGQPVWKLANGNFFVYSGTDGKWFIARTSEEVRVGGSFSCCKGSIYTRAAHEGRMPHEMKANWRTHNGEKWLDDGSVEVVVEDFAAPTVLTVISKSRQERISGRYDLQKDQWSHGQPVWTQANGQFLLYSDPNGKWFISSLSNEVKIGGNFNCSEGWLYNPIAHGGKFPDSFETGWITYDDESQAFLSDETVQTVVGVPVTPPLSLHVTSAINQKEMAGFYSLVHGQASNGQPVWKQNAGPYFFYSGTDGEWYISVETQEVRIGGSFNCSSGDVSFPLPHCGLPPNEMDTTTEIWHTWNGEDWDEDSSIIVDSRTPPPPDMLRVTSADQQVEKSGYYQLEQQNFNGVPMWRQVGGRFLIYSGTNERWYIEEESKLNCNHGGIASSVVHAGLMPHLMKNVCGNWSIFDGAAFAEDSSVEIVANRLPAFPPLMHLTSPTSHQEKSGSYIYTGQMVHGQPVWKQANGNCWMFSGPNGQWIIEATSARVKYGGSFDVSAGSLFNPVAHGGLMPHAIKDAKGSWKVYNGSGWIEDATVDVRDEAPIPPPVLHIVSPTRLCEKSGAYHLLENEMANGQPVWKQANGIFFLFSGSDGCWQIKATSDQVKIGGTYIGPTGSLYHSVAHCGMMPNDVKRFKGAFSTFEDGDFIADPSVEITTTIPVPIRRLHVSSPRRHCEKSGYYLLVDEQLANGQPVWRQAGGQFWIYSSISGEWYIAESSNVIRIGGNFSCSVGGVRNPGGHGNIMPHDLESPWEVLDGDMRTMAKEVKIIAAGPVIPPLFEFVVSGETCEEYRGSYVLVADQWLNGQPMWKHMSNNVWLYSDTGGRWCFSSSSGQADPSEPSCRAAIRTQGLHGGMLPQNAGAFCVYQEWGSDWFPAENIKVECPDALRLLATRLSACIFLGSRLNPVEGVLDELKNPRTNFEECLDRACVNLPYGRLHLALNWVQQKRKEIQAIEGMTEEAAMAIYLYQFTDSVFDELNSQLINSDRSVLVAKWYPFLRHLLEGILALKRQQGNQPKLLHRVVKGNLLKDGPGMYKKGMSITWWPPTACTGEVDCLQEKTAPDLGEWELDAIFMDARSPKTPEPHTVLNIFANHSVNISDFSPYRYEHERILLPGTRLTVTGTATISGVAIIDLEEMPEVHRGVS